MYRVTVNQVSVAGNQSSISQMSVKFWLGISRHASRCSTDPHISPYVNRYSTDAQLNQLLANISAMYRSTLGQNKANTWLTNQPSVGQQMSQ